MEQPQKLAYSISNLCDAKDFTKAQASHDACVSYWSETKSQAEKCAEYLAGRPFTSVELAQYKATNRAPVVFNPLPASRRTVLGYFISNRFDVEFTPVESDDQALSDALRQLSIHEESANNDAAQDLEVIDNAWWGAQGFRIVWPEVQPLELPHTDSAVLNPFAVYPDPSSREFVTRDDAAFIDVVLWMSLDQIVERWPDAKVKAELLRQEGIGPDSYESVNLSADRGHESRTQRNGLFKVIERYYRVTKLVPCLVTPDFDVIEIKDQDKFAAAGVNGQVVKRKMEFLYVAQWAPDVLEEKAFLYNGRYHAQPRNPKTRKIMFPIVELYAEKVGALPQSFVTPLCDPYKLFCALVTNVLESAKHSPSAYEYDPKRYLNESEARRAAELGAHSGERFAVAPGVQPGTAMAPVQKASVNQDHDTGLALVRNYLNEQSSTPPALQGLSESDKPSGVLNGQRIDQASMQMSNFVANLRAYLKRVKELRYAYWREFYTHEIVLRVTGEEGKPQSVTLNGEQQANDRFGFPIPGRTEKVNDINSALFDVRLVDSVKSPTYRDKQLRTIEMVLQSNAVAADPQMAVTLLHEYMRLQDASQQVKDAIAARAQQVAQVQGMQEQLGVAQQMQQVAQTEAEQAGIPQQNIPQPTEQGAPQGVAMPQTMQSA